MHCSSQLLLQILTKLYQAIGLSDNKIIKKLYEKNIQQKF